MAGLALQRAILFTMFALLVVPLGAMALATWQDDRRGEPLPADAESPLVFPKPAMLRVAAYSQLLAYGAMAMMPASLAIAKLLEIESEWIIVPAFAFFPVGGFHLGMSAAIRCPRCNLRLLLNRQKRPRFGAPSKNWNAWAELLSTIRKRQPFRCMFCGQRYHFGEDVQQS
jgi:DNA-directed RNA polymerase subunit RPC12/RpoP